MPSGHVDLWLRTDQIMAAYFANPTHILVHTWKLALSAYSPCTTYVCVHTVKWNVVGQTVGHAAECL